MGTLHRRASRNSYCSGWMDFKLSGERDYRRVFAKLQNKELLLYSNETASKGARAHVEDYLSLKNVRNVTLQLSTKNLIGKTIPHPMVIVTYRPLQPHKEAKIKCEEMLNLKKWYRFIHVVAMLQMPNEATDQLLPGQIQHLHDVINELSSPRNSKPCPKDRRLSAPLFPPARMPQAPPTRMPRAYQTNETMNEAQLTSQEESTNENTYLCMKAVPLPIRKISLPNPSNTFHNSLDAVRKINPIPEFANHLNHAHDVNDDVNSKSMTNSCVREHNMLSRKSWGYFTSHCETNSLVYDERTQRNITIKHNPDNFSLPQQPQPPCSAEPPPEPALENYVETSRLSSSHQISDPESTRQGSKNLSPMFHSNNSPNEFSFPDDQRIPEPPPKETAPLFSKRILPLSNHINTSKPLENVVIGQTPPQETLHLKQNSSEGINNTHKWFVRSVLSRSQTETVLHRSSRFGNMLLRKRERSKNDPWTYSVSVLCSDTTFKHYLVREDFTSAPPQYVIRIDDEDPLPRIASLEGVMEFFKARSGGEFEPLRDVIFTTKLKAYNDCLPEANQEASVPVESPYANRLKRS